MFPVSHLDKQINSQLIKNFSICFSLEERFWSDSRKRLNFILLSWTFWLKLFVQKSSIELYTQKAVQFWKTLFSNLYILHICYFILCLGYRTEESDCCDTWYVHFSTGLLISFPFKLKKDFCLQKGLAFTCGEMRKKASFCYGHYIMSVTEILFTPLQQECQMGQKQLSENIFCIEFNKFCYADEILEMCVLV